MVRLAWAGVDSVIRGWGSGGFEEDIEELVEFRRALRKEDFAVDLEASAEFLVLADENDGAAGACGETVDGGVCEHALAGDFGLLVDGMAALSQVGVEGLFDLFFGHCWKDIRRSQAAVHELSSFFLYIRRSVAKGVPSFEFWMFFSVDVTVGGLRHIFSFGLLSGGSAATRPTYRSIFRVMKMYVGNLSFDASGDDVTEAFSQYGQVTDVHLPLDRDTGRPRGFAFVTMSSKEEMIAAIKGMDGADLMGRDLRVNEAQPREDRGGGGGGGYRGGGGDRRGGGNNRGGGRDRRGGGGYRG